MSNVLGAYEIDELVDALLTPGHELGPQVRADPYPLYAHLRRTAPVYQALDGRWIVTTYDLCEQVLRSDRWHREPDVADEDLSLAVRVFMRSIAFRDPPVHTRLRRSIAPSFTPSSVSAWQSIVERRVAEVLAEVSDADQFDMRNGPAYRLPVLVIGDLLGIPEQDVFGFDEWSATLLHLDEHEHAGPAMERANAAAQEALDFFDELIAYRRTNLGDDLVSRLVADQASSGLTVADIAGLCILLHIGGHSTTNDLLANSLIHVLSDPAAHHRLRENPSLIDSAVEEMLRFDTVIQASLPRIASEEIQLGSASIGVGDSVHAVLAAANRDPKHFDRPDVFDVARAVDRHLSFASGIHFCLGAHLARMEMRTFYRKLMAEHPPLRLDVDRDELVWMDSFLHRGVTTLPVAWERSGT